MDTGKCIVNMLNCRQGEHCLFRSFGLGHVTDQVGRLRKAQVTQELAKWYPNVRSVEIVQQGETYNIRITGVE
jgi:hypothetical protein